MSDAAIQVEKADKKYVIGHQIERKSDATFRDLLVRKSVGFFQRTKNALARRSIIPGHTFEEIWALRDVTFDVQPGEIVGIIGGNGAGKSTLLKILSGITEPSAGRVTTRGRVASLLEVGTGFHPELTGRENIFLNGAILGMTRADIRKRFDEIVAFSEVEKFIDTPVKRFSSGMYVRLAFSVAAHLEPDILIIDEVLAVGDAQFQKKSLGKIGAVSSQEGRTVLFVSHQMGMVTSLCQRALLLEQGRLVFEGAPADAVATYHNEGGDQPYAVDFTKSSRKSATNLRRCFPVQSRTLKGVQPARSILTAVSKSSSHMHSIAPQNVLHSLLFMSTIHKASAYLYRPVHFRWMLVKVFTESTCIIPKNFLNDDVYSIDLILTYLHAGVHECFHERNVLSVVMVDPIEDTLNEKVRNGYRGSFAGAVRPELSWQTRRVS